MILIAAFNSPIHLIALTRDGVHLASKIESSAAGIMAAKCIDRLQI